MTTRRLIWTALFAIGAALTGGCASDRPDAEFESVQSVVFHRIGQRPQWNQTSADDRSAAKAVAELLAKNLTPDSAIQIALLNNRDLQATYADLGIAQADLVQAGLLKNPVFAAAFEPADGGEGIKIQMSVVEDFLDVLQIPLRKRVAAADLEAAKLMASKAIVEKAGEVRRAFYTREAEQDVLGLRQSIAQGSAGALDLGKRLHDAGNISDLDFYNQESANEDIQLALSDGQAQAESGREEFNELLGLSGAQTHWVIAAALAPLPEAQDPLDGIEYRAIENNFDLAATRWRIDAAAAKHGIKKDFGAMSEVDLGAATEEEVHGPWETGPAFSLPIPIFDFGQAQKARAKAELLRQWEIFRGTFVRVGAGARREAALLRAAYQRAERIGKVILPLRRRIVEQTQLNYNGMLAGPFQLLTARQNEIESAVTELQARREYWIHRATLDQIIAGGNGDMP